MHHANHFYGHAHIMARYVGLEEPLRIWGYLQHGWNMHDGFAVGTVFAPSYPKLVWSQACVRRGWAAGLRDYRLVAAPWLYLLRMEEQDQWLTQPGNTPDEREGTIVYPFHGWEGQQVIGNHAAYINEIRCTEGDVPITVCLHWNEFDNPKVRREYEDAGVRVITHGERGYLWKDTDVAFLYRQLAEMRRHKRVVSNRMSSAILYASAAGVEAGIYGDPMALESDHAILGGVGKPRRMWPDMHQVSIPMDYARSVADEELGALDVLHPEEVIEAFGWTEAMGQVPGPPPPAPSLEFPEGFFTRRRKSQPSSHAGPAGAENQLVEASWLDSADDDVDSDTDDRESSEPDDKDRTSTRGSRDEARGSSRSDDTEGASTIDEEPAPTVATDAAGSSASSVDAHLNQD